MRTAAICLSVALGASHGSLAQGAGDAMEKLRACSVLPQAGRLECLQKLSHDIAPPASPASEAAGTADNWIVSETTSPLDYTAITIATVSTSASGGATMQLSIQCRGGRTDLMIDSPALTRRAEEYVVSYAVNSGQPVAVAAGTPASGTGIAVRVDVAALLASLPDGGDIAFRVAGRQGAILEGRYGLAALKSVGGRLSGPCKWPTTAGTYRNR